MKFEAPRGTHDILPSEQRRWRSVIGEAERLCALYGYRRIDTPVFEDTELFARTSGQGSDVVQKEMYTFQDLSGRSLTLRPEGTAPNARAYLQHGLHQQPQPVKTYMVATMYRYAAPQKGRHREHWQWSVEALGSADPAIDAELIHLYDTFLKRVRVRNYTLKLNSIGDRKCRPHYIDALRAWLRANDHLLDDEARSKRELSPLRVFDSKNPNVRAALASAPQLAEYMCDECRSHFHRVRTYLNRLGVSYELDNRLVRGLDYYTRTTWEFVGPHEGSQSSLSGGGRYDDLVQEIGGEPTPGVGFGAGIERLLDARPWRTSRRRLVDVFVARGPAAHDEDVIALLGAIRERRVRADTDYVGRSQKGQEKLMSRQQPRLTVYVGLGVTIRELGRPDEQVSYTDAPDRIVERLRG